MRNIVVLGAALVACSGSVADSGVGGNIGAPCVTQQEADPRFAGFSEREVSIETAKGEPSGASVCLVYHFRGRASCPYGQDANGNAPDGASACVTSDGRTPVTGSGVAPQGARVVPQCADRRPANAIFTSCRCANDEGRTDDGDAYCACPSGTTCTSAIASIGASTSHLAGSYCVRSDAAFNLADTCVAACDPTTHPCP